MKLSLPDNLIVGAPVTAVYVHNSLITPEENSEQLRAAQNAANQLCIPFQDINLHAEQWNLLKRYVKFRSKCSYLKCFYAYSRKQLFQVSTHLSVKYTQDSDKIMWYERVPPFNCLTYIHWVRVVTAQGKQEIWM